LKFSASREHNSSMMALSCKVAELNSAVSEHCWHAD
jgi:hypothetical protein